MKDSVLGYKSCKNGIIVETAKHVCSLTFINHSIIRVKYCFSKELSGDSSYAVVLSVEPVEQDSFMHNEKIVVSQIPFDIEERPESITLTGENLKVEILRESFSIAIYDKGGNCLHRDISERAYHMDRNGRRFNYFAVDGFNHFYGFGEKTGELNKYKKRMRMYTCDTIGYDAEKTDPLYKHIPFFVKLDHEKNIACGSFYDCTANGAFDIACERSGYFDEYAYFTCDDRDLDFYFIYGPTIKEVVRSYSDLTGKTIMPTLPSLGYMASTMYYTELDKDCDKEILNFVDCLDSQDIPCDGFHLSSGYTVIDGRRYVFNWNYTRFPKPEAFIKEMSDRGVYLSPNIKPAMLTDHPLYREFEEEGAFIVDKETGKPCLERYWGGMASLVDFTKEGGRRLWRKYLKKSLFDFGITALWDDNNEYEINDYDAICHRDGAPAPANVIKPILPNLMAKTALEEYASSMPDTRPYILSRSGYAGIQRYAQTWAGDNFTSWKTLKYNIPTMLGMGLSGVANQGCDIGGFHGPAPSGELFVRWVQNGIFQPRFSIHSCNTDNTVTLPWAYKSYTPYIRDAIKLRYSLALYLYSLFNQASEVGDPVMRPMIYEFSDQPDNSFDFMFGPWLLIANVLEEGATTREVYLPKVCRWYDYHTHKCYDGGQSICLDAGLDTIPILYREGAIIPFINPLSRLKAEAISYCRLLIAPSEKSQFVLYEDDGVTNSYKDGDYLKTEITVSKNHKDTVVEFSSEGEYKSNIKNVELQVVCDFESPLEVYVGEMPLKRCLSSDEYESGNSCFYFDQEIRHVFIKYNRPEGDYKANICYAVRNLLGAM